MATSQAIITYQEFESWAQWHRNKKYLPHFDNSTYKEIMTPQTSIA